MRIDHSQGHDDGFIRYQDSVMNEELILAWDLRSCNLILRTWYNQCRQMYTPTILLTSNWLPLLLLRCTATAMSSDPVTVESDC